MNYNDATDYILNIPKFSKKTTKENSLKILEMLGNPQNDYKIIHVAGTNGKGSTCAFLHSIFTNNNIKSGLFTSPHLVKVNERIRVSNQIVSDELFLKAFNEVYDIVKRAVDKGYSHPPFFEFLFLMSMVVFRIEKVSYVILETGLGGRLDATNVIEKPLISIITSISLEHTEILGDTVEKITSEKAGIIKEHTPIVYYASDEVVAEVIECKALEMKTRSYPVYDNEIKIIKKSDKNIDFSINCMYYEYGTVSVSFPASYQTINATLAIIAFEVMKKSDKTLENITNERVLDAISNTKWEGRMEEIHDGVYLDGAHNVSGIEKFIESVNDISTIKNKGKKYLVFSVVKEKNYIKMIELLGNGVKWDYIYIGNIDSNRALQKEDIRKQFNVDCEVVVFDSVVEAYKEAISKKTQNDLVFCAGSLYLVGEIRKEA